MLSDTRNARPVLSLSGLVLFAFRPSRKLRFLGRFCTVCRTLILQPWQAFTLRYPQPINRLLVKAMSKRYRALQRCTIMPVDNVSDNISVIRGTAPHPYARVSLRSINHIDYILIVVGASLLLLMSALCKVLFDNWSRPGSLLVCDWSQ